MKTKFFLPGLSLVLMALLCSCEKLTDLFDGNKDNKTNKNGEFESLPKDGLVAYFPFNENVYDESDYLNDATNYGVRFTQDRNGNANKAAIFNGSGNFLSVPHNSLYNFGTGNFTLFAIVKTGVVPTYSWNAILSKHNSECQHDSEFFLCVEGTTGHPYFGLSTNKGVFERIYGQRSICDNNYHILCGLRENGKLMFYVDGALIGSMKSTINPDNNNQLNIGRSSYNSGQGYFNGVIDDILIYNRALTEQEIKTLSN